MTSSCKALTQFYFVTSRIGVQHAATNGAAHATLTPVRVPKNGGMNVTRLDPHPLIAPSLDESIGTNIDGPSLIRVPDWVRNPLGRYYLYFGHHNGKFIRMAFADAIEGSKDQALVLEPR